MKIKIKLGDIIAILVKDDLYTYGQLVGYGVDGGKGGGLYIIYDMIGSLYPNLDNIINKEILFIFNTIHYNVNNGSWKIIGNRSIPNNISWPEYVVDTISEGKTLKMIMDHTGKFIRIANIKEVRELKNFCSYSPSYIDQVVRSKFGESIWRDKYNDIIYNKKDQ